MKSDVILIDNHGSGFSEAVNAAKQIARFKGLGEKETLRLQLLAEELLSMARSVTGEMQASFWLECEENTYELHMTTEAVLGREMRSNLIAAATSKRNEAAGSFLGRLRDVFEQAMASDVYYTSDYIFYEMTGEMRADQPISVVDGPEWDRYELSILKKLADEVKVYIRGRQVHLSVKKTFA